MLSLLALFVPLAIAPALEAQVTNGDFESGNTGFTSGYTFGNVSGAGTYTIGSDPSAATGSFPDWESFGDHTSGTGLMLIANGATNASTPIWSQTVSVTPNTIYRLSFWGATINTASASPANVVIEINGDPVGGNNIFPGASPATGGGWVQFTADWSSGANTMAAIELFDSNTAVAFNDFALDDIALTVPNISAPVMSAVFMTLLALGLILVGWYNTRGCHTIVKRTRHRRTRSKSA